MFRGLFVGIDRYASPRINWLSCARRDAVALHALFSDNLGDGARLLVDEQATKADIEQALLELQGADADDFIVIGFSGHGTDSHELVTYDTDPFTLSTSSISLERLTELVSQIPSHRLLCVLDCCFSGGMGAKVLSLGIKARSLDSTESLLAQLSGKGRIVFTASMATEEAYEDSTRGHGFLTHFLLEALQGAEEVREGNRISLYRLLDFVTKRVVAEADRGGRPQHPTMRGQIDGELVLPQFTLGARYFEAFPDRTPARVTEELSSLAGFGFPRALIDAWGGSITKLNQLQIDAINEFGLLKGQHLVVSAPTSAGKTMIGELAALKGAIERKRAFFLLPLKALVNDKHQYFSRTYGEFGVRTIRATGEITDDIPALMRGQYDMCLMTYEKFAALIAGAPHLLRQTGTIVVDEVQMIADEGRGANLEFVLTVLRMQARHGVEPQLIALSAVIGDTNGLERWLGARLLRRDERPVPLEEGILQADGSFRYLDPSKTERVVESFIQRQWGKGSSQDWVIPLVCRLVSEGKQVIVFRETRGEARGCAGYLARELGLAAAREAIEDLPTGDPSGASAALRQALAGGVAFHISDLDRSERQVVEDHFRRPGTKLRVIAATTTLAMGINTPAEAVIVVGLTHPPDTPYSVAEYKNMVGRAGRLGFTNRGTSFLLAATPRDEYVLWERYVRGAPENIRSRFLARETDLRSLVIRVIVAAQRTAAHALASNEVIEFLDSSFGAFQQRLGADHWTWDRRHIEEALANLESHQLIDRDHAGGYRITPLGQLAGAGVEVESVVRLVGGLRSATPESINETTLIAASQITVELDGVLFPINRKSTKKEPGAWTSELMRQEVAPSVLSSLHRNVDDVVEATLRAKKAAACLLWITDWPMTRIEDTMTQFGGKFDGAAGPIRSVAARTCDLLPTVIRVAELLHPDLHLGDRGARLLARLTVGVPGEIVELAGEIGNRFDRSDYQALLRAGLSSIAALENATDDALRECLRDNTKVEAMRKAVQGLRERERLGEPVVPPILPKFER